MGLQPGQCQLRCLRHSFQHAPGGSTWDLSTRSLQWPGNTIQLVKGSSQAPPLQPTPASSPHSLSRFCPLEAENVSSTHSRGGLCSPSPHPPPACHGRCALPRNSRNRTRDGLCAPHTPEQLVCSSPQNHLVGLLSRSAATPLSRVSSTQKSRTVENLAAAHSKHIMFKLSTALFHRADLEPD